MDDGAARVRPERGETRSRRCVCEDCGLRAAGPAESASTGSRQLAHDHVDESSIMSGRRERAVTDHGISVALVEVVPGKRGCVPAQYLEELGLTLQADAQRVRSDLERANTYGRP